MLQTSRSSLRLASRAIPLVCILIVVALPMAARAVDGVLEINHAAALVGGVTPGDRPGDPVSLGASGSYRLTGDLTQPDPDTPVIDVTEADVRIDLNGFATRGTNNRGSVQEQIAQRVGVKCTDSQVLFQKPRNSTSNELHTG